MVENLNMVDGWLCLRFWVMWLSSRAIVKPIRVTARAVSFRCGGMVIWGTVEGVILLEIINPAKMLPIRRRVIEFINRGLFSLITIKGEYRGFPSVAKKMIRVLYMAVSEVATRVINRAQAFV